MPHDVVVDVLVPTAPVVDVASVGVQGPPGEPGPPGPPGPPGGAVAHAVTHQSGGNDAITALDAAVLTGTVTTNVIAPIVTATTLQLGAKIALVEATAPAVPATNQAHLWLQDNGAGKSQLMVQFATGAAVQLAIQPEGAALPFGGVVSVANLVSYWKLDEASGTRQDSHGTNHLTPTNAPVGAAGKIGNGCDFESSSSQYLSHADPSPLGDEDFTYTCWFKSESAPAAMQLITKDHDTGRSYHLQVSYGEGIIKYVLGADAVTVNHGLTADTNWHFVVVWHDATANTLNLQLDNGTPGSVGTGGVFPALNPAIPVRIGARQYPVFEQYFDGLIDEVGLWRRVLTAQERTDLYNGGAGLAY